MMTRDVARVGTSALKAQADACKVAAGRPRVTVALKGQKELSHETGEGERQAAREIMETSMRLPVLSPAELTDEQKPLYKDMRAGIQSHFKGFLNVRSDGALLGPWNPWIREPKFGRPVWELVKTIVAQPSLPAAIREVAILVTGAHFRSAYELYAHVLVAEQRGLSDEKLATIVAGQRPPDLTRHEAVAYDFASALVNGGVLPELSYKAAVREFGEHGAAELSYLVAVYCLVSVTLNTFDVPVPG
jgi:alkylhydroperoxidase family enzyme